MTTTKARQAHIPRLMLEDFSRYIRGKKFSEQHLKFQRESDGYYADSLLRFRERFTRLPPSYLPDFYTVCLLKAGRMTCTVQTETIQLQTGTIYITRPGQMIRWHAADKADGYLIAFSWEYLHSLKYRKNMFLEFPFLSTHAGTSLSVPPEAHQKLIQVADKIPGAFIEKDQYAYELIQLWTLELLILIKRYQQPGEKMTQIASTDTCAEVTQLFLELLEAHLATGVRANLISKKGVADYARELSLSSSQLNHHIRAYLGKSPKTIILERYTLTAKCMLIHTDIPISEICYILGYDNPPYFSANFKKHVGMTPKDFRQQAKQSWKALGP